MKERRRKTLGSLIVALAVAAIAAPLAQGGSEARSERSAVVQPTSSFYSSPAYHALMVRSAAMNTWYRQHSTASTASSAIPDAFSRELTKAASVAASVRHADDRAGVRGPGITQTPQLVASTGDGFNWGDASLGAGAALVAAIVIGGIALSRRNRTEPVAV